MKKTTVLFFALLLTACSSIINGSHQNMSLSAAPSNAKIELFNSNGAKIADGDGSLTYSLKRSNGFCRC